MNELSNPEISIIIPTFNRGELLGETLDSIITQTFKDWECIVVDDGSTDHTAELLEFYMERDLRFFYHRRPENRPKGANACRNFGFEICNGKYINWFDSDDLMHPEKLRIQLEALKTSSESFSVCQNLIFEDSLENILGYRTEKIYSKSAFFDYLTMGMGFMTPSVLWKRKFLREMDKLFDEELQAAQEWEFHLRALDKNTDYLTEDEPLVYIRKNPQGITYNNSEDFRFYHYFLARLKIYQNNQLQLSPESRNFLSQYLLKAFKRMIVTKNKYVNKAWRRFVLREDRVSKNAKTYGFLAMYLYKFFNKGNFVLEKIRYS